MAFSGGGNRNSRQNFSDINITPLTDVFLVLLVIMILLAPLLDNQAALKVDPPAAQSAQNSDTSKIKSILIEVSKEGVIALNGKQLIEATLPNEQVQEKLYSALAEEGKAIEKETPGQKPTVKLKADNKVDYGRVVSVLDAVNKAQLGKLSLLTTVPPEGQ